MLCCNALNRGLCYNSLMRGLADIYLDVRGGDIIVDLPGTSYTVTYHKPAVSRQLLLLTRLLRTTFGPGLRKLNSSPEHGVSRTRRREN